MSALKPGDIAIDLNLDNRSFTVGVMDSGNKLRQLRQELLATGYGLDKLEKNAATTGSRFRTFTQTTASLRFALLDFNNIFLSLPMSVLKTSGEIERLQKMMEGLSTKTDLAAKKLEAAANVKFVFNMAQNAPFEVKSLTDAFVKMKIAGLDPANGSLQALVDSMAKFGGGSDELNRSVIALMQMVGKGAISMEELRQQLGEAWPDAMRTMARSMNLTIGELQKLIATGTVESVSAIKKMLYQAAADNEGLAKNMMSTWVGMLENLKTKWSLFQIEVGKSGGFDLAKQEMQSLLDSFDSQRAKEWAFELGEMMNNLTVGTTTLAKALMNNSELLSGAAMAMAGTALISAVKSFHSAGNQTIETFQQIKEASKESQRQMLEDNQKKYQSLIENNKKQLEDARVHYQNMFKEHQTFLMQKVEAEVKAEETLRKKKKGTAAAAKEWQQEADRMGQNQRVAQEYMLTTQGLINTLEKKDAILRQSAASEGKVADAMKKSAAAIEAETRALGEQAAQVRNLEREKRKLSGVSHNLTAAMGTLGNAVRSQLVDFKNFAISSLTLSAQLTAMWAVMEVGITLWKHMSAAIRDTSVEAEAAAERIRKARMGIELTKKEMEAQATYTKQAGINVESARAYEEHGEVGDVDAGMAFANLSRGDVKSLEKESKEAQAGSAELDKIKKAKNEEAKSRSIIADAEEQITNARKRAAAEKLDYIKSKGYETADDLVKDADLKGDKALAFGLTKYGQDIRHKYEMEAINGEIAKQEETMRRLSVAREKTAHGSKEWQRLTDEAVNQQEAIDKLQEMAGSMLKGYEGGAAGEAVLTTGKGGKGKGKGSNFVPKEDPLVRLFETERARLAAAQIELDALLSDTRTYATTREKLEAILAGQMAAGKFDSPIMKNGKVAGMRKMGGENRRDDPLKALKSLTGEDAQMMKGVLDSMAKLESINKAIKLVTDVTKEMSQAEAAMQAALVSWTDTGYLKTSSGIQSLTKSFAKHKVELDGVDEKYKTQIIMLQKLAMGYQHAEDSVNAIIDANEKYKSAVLDSISDSATRREQEHLRNIADIKEEYEARKRGIAESLKQDFLSAQQRESLQRGLHANEEAHLKQMEIERLRHAESSKTAMKGLTEQWKDWNKSIDDAAAGWADDFLDEFNKFLTTGEADWRQFLVGMLTEMSRINLQGAFGDLFAEGFTGIGDMFKNVMAGGRNGGESMLTGTLSGSPLAGQLTEHLNSFQNSLKNSTVVTDGLASSMEYMQGVSDLVTTAISGTNVLVDTAGLSTMQMGIGAEAAAVTLNTLTVAATQASAALASIQAANAAKASGIASMFSFADGGIMTSKGKLPFRQYAKGGIANSPQLALFGEGAMNEAYVPLPDGKSIPVSFKDMPAPAGVSQAVSITITVNEAEGSTNTQSSGASDNSAKMWKDLANSVKNMVVEEMAKQKAPGGALYR